MNLVSCRPQSYLSWGLIYLSHLAVDFEEREKEYQRKTVVLGKVEYRRKKTLTGTTYSKTNAGHKQTNICIYQNRLEIACFYGALHL